MQFGYPYLIRLRSSFKIQSDPVPVQNCSIRLDRDPETGSWSTLVNNTGVQEPVSSDISDLLLFVSYCASQNKETKVGNDFFEVCYVN